MAARNEAGPKIRKTQWHGLTAVQIEAGGYEALMIPSVGANTVSLKNSSLRADILRTPAEDEVELFVLKPQTFGIPILFPPNRIEDGTYTWNGVTYTFPINNLKQNNHNHGVLKTQPFTVTRTETGAEYAEVEASFFSNEVNDEIFRSFPHPFVCRMIYRLSAEGLTHTVSFTNLDNRPMPIGIGYHTPIRVPFIEGGHPEDYRLLLSAGEHWVLNDRTLPTGERVPLSGEERKLREEGMSPVGSAMEMAVSNCPLTLDGEPYSGAVMIDTRSGHRVFYEVDPQVTYWTFWNNGGDKPWACAEPQTWATNAPNLKLDASVTGFQTIAPSETWHTTSRIYVK